MARKKQIDVGGRPALPKDLKRTQAVRVFLNEYEHRYVMRMADAMAGSVADYIRAAVIDYGRRVTNKRLEH